MVTESRVGSGNVRIFIELLTRLTINIGNRRHARSDRLQCRNFRNHSGAKIAAHQKNNKPAAEKENMATYLLSPANTVSAKAKPMNLFARPRTVGAIHRRRECVRDTI